MLTSDSTLKSAAPAIDSSVALPDVGEVIALTGGTLVELHPPRMGKADVIVRGNAIVQIGGEIPEEAQRIDVSGCFVTPAFVVAHGHLYMSLATGMPSPPQTPRTLTDHLQWIWWTLDKALDEELVHTSALVGAAMAAKAGAACVIDLHSSPRSIAGSLDRIELALDEVGIRGVLAYETSDREGRGRRDGALAENRRFLEKVKAGKTRHRAMVGAHALMSLNDDTLDALRDLAEAFSVGIHVHVAEDLTDLLDAERNRKAPLTTRLDRLGVARRGSVVAHAVQLEGATIEAIKSAGGTIVTNPRSNMAHGVGVCSAGGGRVALGTDGIDGDILAEARAYWLRHTEARDNLAREVGARVVAGQELATALFADLQQPRLVTGARADLTVLDYDPITPMTPSNVIEHLVRGWSSAHVRHTMVGGEMVVKDRKLVKVDERELLLRGRAAAGRLWERMQGYF